MSSESDNPSGPSESPAGVDLMGLQDKTFTHTFNAVLQLQEDTGLWGEQKADMVHSKTAIAVKTLHVLSYDKEWKWKLDRDRGSGGVTNALSYLGKELDDARDKKSYAGQDWWDHCMILLAVHSYLGPTAVAVHVRDIEENWQARYDDASNKRDPWFGPALLAAMIDVLDTCGATDEKVVTLMVSSLLQKEASEGPDKLGYYQNAKPIEPRDQWQTGLVLCTLCEHAAGNPEVSEAVDRTVGWLLSKQERKQRWGAEGEQHDSMYTARVLKGLVAAIPFFSKELKPKLDDAIKTGNAWLAAFQTGDGQFADDKATIVVLEYLSSLPKKVPPPAYVEPRRTSLREKFLHPTLWELIGAVGMILGLIIGVWSLL